MAKTITAEDLLALVDVPEVFLLGLLKKSLDDYLKDRTSASKGALQYMCLMINTKLSPAFNRDPHTFVKNAMAFVNTDGLIRPDTFKNLN